MKIGELSKISGLAPSRIRFYEASGLINSVGRKANGYRDYTPDTEWVLQIITGAQAAGFSLEEIRQLLPMKADGWRHEDLLVGLKRKVEEIEALQQRLALNKAQLLRVIDGIESKPEGLGCGDNAQLMLDRLREECAEPPAARSPQPAAVIEPRSFDGVKGVDLKVDFNLKVVALPMRTAP
jgi:DNA-binding transcriptional MerR regulator